MEQEIATSKDVIARVAEMSGESIEKIEVLFKFMINEELPRLAEDDKIVSLEFGGLGVLYETIMGNKYSRRFSSNKDKYSKKIARMEAVKNRVNRHAAPPSMYRKRWTLGMSLEEQENFQNNLVDKLEGNRNE